MSEEVVATYIIDGKVFVSARIIRTFLEEAEMAGLDKMALAHLDDALAKIEIATLGLLGG